MKPLSSLRLLLGMLMLGVLPVVARAQDTAADTTHRYQSIPRSQRPAVMVMPFEFHATLTDEDRDEMNSIGALVAALKSPNAAERQQNSMENLGRAVSDLLMADLLESGQFRVLERQALDDVTKEQNLTASSSAAAGQNVAQKAKLLGAQYMITGAITQFGHEKKQKGGGLGRFGGKIGAVAGALGASKDNYNVSVTLRVVDTATGEVVASLTGEGKSEGGKSFGLGGLGGAAGAVFGSKTSGDRERKVGEAVANAVIDLTDGLVKKRESGDIEAIAAVSGK